LGHGSQLPRRLTLVGTIVGLALAALLPRTPGVARRRSRRRLSAATLFFVPASPPFVATVRSGAQVPTGGISSSPSSPRVGRAGDDASEYLRAVFLSRRARIYNASLNTGLVAGAALVGAVASSVAAGVYAIGSIAALVCLPACR